MHSRALATLRCAAAIALISAAAPRAMAQDAPRGPSPGAGQPTPAGSRAFGIARLKYGGGGDWYEDRTSLVNLLAGLRQRTAIAVAGEREAIVEPGSAALFQYPFLFACGHGNIKFSATEVASMRRYLTTGGFLWVDDDFGIDVSFRREIRRIFPETALIELPFSHSIFHGLYEFPRGLPKIHEHAGGAPKAYGIVHDGRLVVLYTHDTDLGDGLEDEEVHKDPPEKREQALRMAINIVHHALTH